MKQIQAFQILSDVDTRLVSGGMNQGDRNTVFLPAPPPPGSNEIWPPPGFRLPLDEMDNPEDTKP